MSNDEVQVDPTDLNGKATQIRGLSWSAQTAQPALISPDALVLSSVAITNLNVNAESLWAFQEYGRVEGDRLAQTLDNVAAAYAEVDQASGESVGDTMGVPGGAPAAGSVMPKGVDIPPLPHPPNMPIPKGIEAADPMWDPLETQQALDAGDDAASLRAAAQMWRGNATSLETSAQQFETKSLLWEGQAADAAYAKFNAYRDWLVGLAGSWERLAGEADRLADAHDAAKSNHRPIADEYRRLYDETMGKPLDASVLAKMQRMAELQGQSEELRNTYARDGQPNQIEPEDPPSPVMGGIPVTAEDNRRARPRRPGEGDGAGEQQGAGGAGGGGQQQPTGGQPQAPQEAPASPMSAGDGAQQAAQQAAQQGSQGGSQGGGSPGGGSPGGGSPGGGMPGAGKGDPHTPKLSNDPSLKPAAAGGSGGGSGGGGGGGVPGSPLQPAVGAETVAPSPVVAPGVPVAAAGAGPGSGGMGGGMGGGGMAPMGHGAQGGSGEKKRNPQLTEDVPLYVEDRPHTEQVIGVRPRRRGTPDDGKKGDTQ